MKLSVIAILGLVIWASPRASAADAPAVADELHNAVVPVESGNHWQPLLGIWTIDAGGSRVVVGGRPGDPASVALIDRPGNKPRVVAIPEIDTFGVRLSADGARLFMNGSFLASDGVSRLGLGYLQTDDGALSPLLALGASNFFGIDRSGRWLAYQAVASGADGASGRQVFLRDNESGAVQQLTNDPQAVSTSIDRDVCPLPTGSTPLLSGDGSRVVFATRATLGIAPADPNVGCRVFVYNVATGQFRLALALPNELVVRGAALSDSGRWYSFVVSRPIGNGLRLATAALLDLDGGAFVESLTGDSQYPSFDSIVSGDGDSVVVSSQADLDPRVGNADHNMELFRYARSSGTFSQLTDTTGGLVGGGGVCPPYAPGVSADGGVVVAPFYGGEYEECRLGGDQRHIGTGLLFRVGRIVRTPPGNRPPQWDLPQAVRVQAGTTLILDIAAGDPDGDPLTFFAQEVDKSDVPRGSVIEDHYDGTATFRWPTRLEQAGEYTLRLAVFDQVGGERVHDVHITVGAADPVPCPGDCDGDAVVGVAELVAGVRIALQENAAASCAAADGDGDGRVSVDELIRATGAALNGC